MKSLIEHLALLTRLAGTPLSAEALTAQARRHPNGRLDLGSISELMSTHGLENTLSERSLAEVPAAAVPLLAILQDEEAVVIARIEGEGDSRRYTVVAPDGVVSVIVAAALEARHLGFVWFAKLAPRQDRRSDLPEFTLPSGWLVKVLWRFRGEYTQVGLTTIVINCLALVGSLYTMNVYDRVIPNKSFDTLWALSLGVIIAIVFENAARVIRAQLTDIAGKKADLIISAALFRRVMSLQLVQAPSSAGSYATNLREFEAVRDIITSATLLALVDLPFVLLFVGMIFMLTGPLGWVPLVSIPLVIGAGLIAQIPLARYTNESAREGAQRQGLAVEAIEGMETLKSLNATSWAQQHWEHYTARTAASSQKLKNVVTSLMSFTNGLQQLNTVVIMLWGTYLVHAEDPAARITVGALIATIILSGRALAPLAQVAGLMSRLNTGRVAMQGIEKMIARPVDRDPNASYVMPNRLQGQLALSQVLFGYPGAEARPTVGPLDLEIRPGEKVAILGRVGSGKSTLLRIMAGLYAPSQGSVTVDGIHAGQIDPSDLRRAIALMGQAPRLFSGTLRENIELAAMDRLLSDDELMAALRRFGLDGFVRSHPRGLDMEVGEDGRGLSGGQKQLIGLTRLSLREPRVVLLDEPTSGLDQASESTVLKSLSEWIGKRTLVIVTHRPQVLDIVDRVIVIDAGRVLLDAPKAQALKVLGGGIPPVPPPAGVAGKPTPPITPAPPGSAAAPVTVEAPSVKLLSTTTAPITPAAAVAPPTVRFKRQPQAATTVAVDEPPAANDKPQEKR